MSEKNKEEKIVIKQYISDDLFSKIIEYLLWARVIKAFKEAGTVECNCDIAINECKYNLINCREELNDCYNNCGIINTDLKNIIGPSFIGTGKSIDFDNIIINSIIGKNYVSTTKDYSFGGVVINVTQVQ